MLQTHAPKISNFQHYRKIEIMRITVQYFGQIAELRRVRNEVFRLNHETEILVKF